MPTPDTILTALVALLSTFPGLTVKPGLPYKVGALPFAYVALETARVDASAQTEVERYGYLIRVLVPWQDQWETSERALNPLIFAIPRLLLAQDALGDVFVDAATLRVDSSERGDGLTQIDGRNYRSAAIRFEVTL